MIDIPVVVATLDLYTQIKAYPNRCPRQLADQQHPPRISGLDRDGNFDVAMIRICICITIVRPWHGKGREEERRWVPTRNQQARIPFRFGIGVPTRGSYAGSIRPCPKL